MLLNNDLGNEVKDVITKSGKSTYRVAKDMGIQPSSLFRMYNSLVIKGLWVDVLDTAGYDVEIVIKKKAK